MGTRTSVSKLSRISKFSELGGAKALGLFLVLSAMAWAVPALAAPTLFTGVGKQAGGIVGTPVLVTTIPGPTAGAPGVASNTPAGGFALPASAFSRATPGYTFTIPPTYPYVYVKITQKNLAGSFSNSYLSPSVPVVGAATNALTPYVTTTPRAGMLRVIPGSKGFGGRMVMDFTKLYRFDISTALGILKAVADDHNDFGGTSVGAFAPGGFAGGLCCSTYPSGAPSLAVTAAIGSARGPWVTGMATAYDPHGGAVTSTTQTAVDARTAFGKSGAISLVTPRTQYVYQGDGTGTLTSLRDAFSNIHSIDVTFIPEPGQLVLLTSGLVFLLGARRFRRTS